MLAVTLWKTTVDTLDAIVTVTPSESSAGTLLGQFPEDSEKQQTKTCPHGSRNLVTNHTFHFKKWS